MRPPVHDWLVAFVWTLAVELPVYWLFLRDRFPERWWAPSAIALAVNCVTHPALWYVVPYRGPYWLWLVTCESAIVMVEALCVALALRWFSDEKNVLRVGALSALSANVASVVFGLVAQ